MKTFNKELKQHWIDVMQGHQDADRLIQGSWWNDEKQTGCFFGCAMQDNEDVLNKAIKAMQLPSWLIYLAEKIFENLPAEEALVFPVQLLKAVPTDTDITEVKHIIAVKRLEPLIEKSHGDEVNNAIQQVISYHKNPKRTENERSEAYSAARSAVRSVVHPADLAIDLAARSAASVAHSAHSAALSAARLAAYSSAHLEARSAYTAESSAYSAAWIKERDNLIQALKEFKK